MDRDTKYDALYDKLCEITEIFGKVLERHMANMNANDDYSEQPMPSPEQEKTQDLDNEQDTYDTQESVEDEEEGNQELPDCLPMPCVTLTKEYQDLLAKADRESGLEEAYDYMEEAESDMEEEVQEDITPPNQLIQEKED